MTYVIPIVTMLGGLIVGLVVGGCAGRKYALDSAAQALRVAHDVFSEQALDSAERHIADEAFRWADNAIVVAREL